MGGSNFRKFSLYKGDMERMTYYLRAGSLKKIAGDIIYSRKIYQRRLLVYIAAGVLFLLGLYNVFF